MRKHLAVLALLVLPATAAAPGSSPRVVAKIKVPVGPCAGVAGFGSFWESTFNTSSLVRVNPRTNRVTRVGRLGFQPCGLAAGAGSIWVDGYGTAKVERV